MEISLMKVRDLDCFVHQKKSFPSRFEHPSGSRSRLPRIDYSDLKLIGMEYRQ